MNLDSRKKPLAIAGALALVALIALFSGSDARSEVEEVVRANLKDPDSARFGEFYHNAGRKRACITVNAKNSMGGYTGDSQMRFEETAAGWEYKGDREETPESCREDWADEPATKSALG